MGLLDQLWDETVAGPPPDTGLGRLRKSYSFSPSSLSAVTPPGGLQVTRSITILRSNSVSTAPSTPSSAASSPRGGLWSAPESPLASSTPRGDWKRLRRKPTPTAPDGAQAAEPRSPTVYDWFVSSIGCYYSHSFPSKLFVELVLIVVLNILCRMVISALDR
ncbi:hypothetical protein Cni_G00763 [Canna indica]|uniref:Uncharacterized protein n=1 Tax=Canna indica TaxID=4628 RepID=A0AAQ3JN77_9LILI|nr:hypothetical protein Cni_G00763 [Canna indica]